MMGSMRKHLSFKRGQSSYTGWIIAAILITVLVTVIGMNVMEAIKNPSETKTTGNQLSNQPTNSTTDSDSVSMPGQGYIAGVINNPRY